MAGVLPTETLASVRTAVARAVNALETTGTVTSSPSATGFTSTSLQKYSSADALKGMEVVFKTGTGAVADNERRINSSTTAGVVAIVGPNFGTNPATNDTFDIYRTNVADLQLLNLAIKWAIELAQDWHLLNWEDYASIVLGSMTKNGGFEDWSTSTTSAPDGWEKDSNSTVSRESTIVLPPFRYSAKLVTDGTNLGYLRQSDIGSTKGGNLLYSYEALSSVSLSVSALVYCATADRVDLRWSDDGSTWQSGTDHGGTGWEKLTVAASTIDANPTQLDVRLHVTAGAAVTVYIHDFRIVPAISLYEYYLPKRFARLAELRREIGTAFEFPHTIPMSRIVSVDRQRERIVFDRALWTPPGEYRVKMVGQTYQAVPSADSDSIDLPLAYIIAAARSFLVAMGRCPDEMRKQASQIHAEAYRLARQLHRQPMANSIRVR